MPVRNKAVELTQRLRQKDFEAEACALLVWVRDQIRYVRDIRTVETLHDPVTLLGFPGHQVGDFRHLPAAMAGDCDDKATLLGALLESIGHEARFVAIAYQPGFFSHVWTQARVRARGPWIDLEPTEPLPCGSRVPPGVAEIYQEV